MPLRIVFCGTPAFAVPSLRHLIAQPDFEIAGVVTQPDRPRGRGQEMHGSPVKDAALEAGIPVYQPEKIKSDEAYRLFQAPRAGRGRHHRLRPDHFAAADRYPAARMDQSARLAAAEISRRRADQLGHREWREAHGPHDDADRCGARHRADASEISNRDRRGRNCARS